MAIEFVRGAGLYPAGCRGGAGVLPAALGCLCAPPLPIIKSSFFLNLDRHRRAVADLLRPAVTVLLRSQHKDLHVVILSVTYM